MKFKVGIVRTVSQTKEFVVEVEDGLSGSIAELQALSKAHEAAANTDFNNPGGAEYDTVFFETIE